MPSLNQTCASRVKVRRAHIPLPIRHELWAMPCVICGDSGDIEIDHITPVSQGGGSDRANLQPLCRQCHCRKGRGHGRTNDELRALYLADATEHHLVNQYRLAIRFMNVYEAPSFGQWKASHA